MKKVLPGLPWSYHSLRDSLPSPGDLEGLPYACRILAENVLRKAGEAGSREALAALVGRRHDVEIPFHPGRVLLQDMTGFPALVDFAGLREAVAAAGGDPRAVYPRVPTHFVIDHSIKADVDGSRPEALALNRAEEERQNAERFAFLSWCGERFANLRVLPRGRGICHQINLEALATVVDLEGEVAIPDTLICTDSHTPMINALGILAWGVGGIEAESVMLGRPVLSALPELVRVELSGRRAPGLSATDLALHLTEFFRKAGVVGAILEFQGPGLDALGIPDRATIANMAPEYGATAALFPIEEATLAYLAMTGRAASQIALVAAYARAQGLWRGDCDAADYDRTLHYDLSAARPSIAGPARPHDRIELGRLAERGMTNAREPACLPAAEGDLLPGDRALVIAAIASCTNTANPRSVVAAALLARKALARGLSRRPWVKGSFTPGSPAVAAYLEAAGLLAPLAELGFGIVGFGCASCNGMSGRLLPGIEEEIGRRRLAAAALVSGNRNFDGRVHPAVTEAYLASPALVVAWSLVGSMRVDIGAAPLGHDLAGRPVTLAELWPSDAEVDEVVARYLRPEHFAEMAALAADGVAVPVGPGGSFGSSRGQDEQDPLFHWDEASNYARMPPYWRKELLSAPRLCDLRPLAILGDNVTTDDLSPSGAILPDSAAGSYLISRGVPIADFNSYGTRRGDHLVTERATLANNRLRNEMAGGREGSLARLEPEGSIGLLYDTAMSYLARGQELLIVAGKNYGAGSSRDWAAKGVRLLGVRAVVAESFERIHRSNLIGMGVLPLEFEKGVTRKTLGLDGTELFTVIGQPRPRIVLELGITRADGSSSLARLLCRLDTEDEARIFAAGGLLPLVCGELAGQDLGSGGVAP